MLERCDEEERYTETAFKRHLENALIVDFMHFL